MTAPLTSVMKAVDQVRGRPLRAISAWALCYVGLIFALARPLGLVRCGVRAARRVRGRSSLLALALSRLPSASRVRAGSRVEARRCRSRGVSARAMVRRDGLSGAPAAVVDRGEGGRFLSPGRRLPVLGGSCGCSDERRARCRVIDARVAADGLRRRSSWVSRDWSTEMRKRAHDHPVFPADGGGRCLPSARFRQVPRGVRVEPIGSSPWTSSSYWIGDESLLAEVPADCRRAPYEDAERTGGALAVAHRPLEARERQSRRSGRAGRFGF